MQKWEYFASAKIWDNDEKAIYEALDRLGRDGWELVAVDLDNTYIFKRPLMDE